MVVESMLNDFLTKTNSKKELSTDKITFVYKALILNNPKNLKHPLSKHFNSNMTYTINVIDNAKIFGGNK